MTRQIFILLVLLFNYHTADAAGWRCYKYHIQITIADKCIDGFITMSDSLCERESNALRETVLKYFHNDSVIFYKKIFPLNFPQIPNLNEGKYYLTAAPRDQIITIDFKDVQNVILMEIMPCHPCISLNENDCYYWSGHNEIITELDNAEITLLKIRPIAMLSSEHPIYESNTIYYLSYNQDIKLADLKNIADNFNVLFKEIHGSEMAKYMIFNSEYWRLKNKLKSKNVVMINLSFDL